ncbi:MAG TPA: glycoside hydrolase family 76 protein, partial [Thermoleophilia bacterium]|nr:glycoside hydrolase family 76 protein [Thermoleophilia bacterium]
RQFDLVWARAWSRDFGGGLWWTTARREKNTCVNAPAVIAAVKLYQSSGDRSYLTRAKRLYAWLRTTLFDPGTGALDDHVYRGAAGGKHEVEGRDRSRYTYNQGTFIGAAEALYETTGSASYRSDARAALDFTVADLTTDGVLDSEGSGGDGGGFKGIFARWAAMFVTSAGLSSYEPWLQLNEHVAWSDRDRRGLVWEDWDAPTLPGRLYSFDCSSAAVLLQVAPPAR